ncbi:MmgE/PrpD family protein [Croceicoccus ponticola]|uniref:MmgE/PrpD family protein n=1 Tax=Croceicoccus ponticola TaxID=2217664 RepID=A0A437H223_9SPHN|nr:MmgE/PrpD family protein [Croceicoccus ponticola]RVQ69670.1 MmgE/PrpD family protein [Croceicoccus ponticola]
MGVESAEMIKEPDPRLADQISKYVARMDLSKMAPSVIEATKDLCISSVGSTVLGARMEVTRALAAYAQDAGGAAQVMPVGQDFATNVEVAAMLNCVASHCTEFEDVAWPEAQYTCFLIPAMLALGEAVDSTGAQVLEAIVIGFEVAARPGMICSNHGAAARGFLSCANLGTIGVAAGAAKLMGLGEKGIRDAVTMAASMGGGLVRQTGSSAHVVEAGFAARDGIVAAQLARNGLGGNPDIFGGKAGYFDALAGQPEISFDLGEGDQLRILSVGQKKYPCCYLLQRIIDELKNIMERNSLVGADIAAVTVDVNGAFPAIVKYDEPSDVEEARFSLPHVLGAVLAGEPMDFLTFVAEKLEDCEILAQRRKVSCRVHNAWGYDQLGEKDLLTVTTVDGTRFRRECVSAHGDPEDPLSREETIAKFMNCTSGILEAETACSVASDIAGLENLRSVRSLMAKLRLSGQPG